MNQRIRELATQAGYKDFDYAIIAHKFAELIVRECAEVAGCNGHVSGFALGDLIKEHLGVK